MTAPAGRRLARALVGSGVVVVSTAMSIAAGAQQVMPVPVLVPAPHEPRTGCAPRAWPKEAIRYEIEGSTRLGFRIAADGTVADAAVVKSSGWTLLDQASLDNVKTCRFHPRLATGPRDAPQPVDYVWTLDGDPVVLPELVHGSCPATARFAGFKPRDPAPTDAAGIRVRMLVDARGEPARIQAEPGAHAPQDVDRALRFVQACRFGFPDKAPGQRTDTMFGKVLFK